MEPGRVGHSIFLGPEIFVSMSQTSTCVVKILQVLKHFNITFAKSPKSNHVSYYIGYDKIGFQDLKDTLTSFCNVCCDGKMQSTNIRYLSLLSFSNTTIQPIHLPPCDHFSCSILIVAFNHKHQNPKDTFTSFCNVCCDGNMRSTNIRYLSP